ncbi:hypothetical protein [Hyunsoonleella ulvae]|uniref:hypothetical protein n=1 Tax=Hyunsoonleella ulvae TaxID=2799948 RepID=UPI00193A667D|nr:hypothetical protein [Hyunsoonleella ulvae]
MEISLFSQQIQNEKIYSHFIEYDTKECFINEGDKRFFYKFVLDNFFKLNDKIFLVISGGHRLNNLVSLNIINKFEYKGSLLIESEFNEEFVLMINEIIFNDNDVLFLKTQSTVQFKDLCDVFKRKSLKKGGFLSKYRVWKEYSGKILNFVSHFDYFIYYSEKEDKTLVELIKKINEIN